MALSGSSNYNLNREEMIIEGYGVLGIGSEGESLTARESTDGATALNMILKSLHNLGVNMWSVKTEEITPILNQQTYTLGEAGADVTMDRPLDILEVYYRETASTTDTPIIKNSREEYWYLSDKSSTGLPVSFYYDAQLILGEFNIWPVADANVVSDYTYQVIYRKPIDDLDLVTDDIEIPQEWYRAIKFMLAADLSYNMGFDRLDRASFEQKAEILKKEAMDYDIEHTSIFFQPEERGRY